MQPEVSQGWPQRPSPGGGITPLLLMLVSTHTSPAEAPCSPLARTAVSNAVTVHIRSFSAISSAPLGLENLILFFFLISFFLFLE